MGFTINHGLISDALGLAQRSGEAMRRRQVASDDMQFLDLVNGMQATADRKYANEISAALQAQEQADRVGLQQQELNANTALRNRGAADDEANTRLRQQALQAEQQQAQQKVAQEQTQQQAMRSYVTDQNNPQALAYYNATGKLAETVVPQNPNVGRAPSINDDPEYVALKAEAQKFKDDYETATKAKSEYVRNQGGMIEDKDANHFALTQAEAAAKAAYDAKYAELLKKVRGFQTATTAQEKTAAANAARGSVADLQVNPQVVQQATQQQAAPAQSGAAPVVNTMQEYAQLPSGTVYVDGQTGLRARKP